jgi:hypothetical protein
MAYAPFAVAGFAGGDKDFESSPSIFFDLLAAWQGLV